MFLTNHYSIKEVLAFPFMKEEQGQSKKLAAEEVGIKAEVEEGIRESRPSDSTTSRDLLISSHELYSAQVGTFVPKERAESQFTSTESGLEPNVKDTSGNHLSERIVEDKHLELIQLGEAYSEGDEPDDLQFSHTLLVLKKGSNYFYARSKDRKGGLNTLNLEDLNATPIPHDHIWPLMPANLTLAPLPLPLESFQKYQSLIDYADSTLKTAARDLLLHEAEVCEILLKHPHPNIATYHGCISDGASIHGLCFVKYVKTLSEHVRIPSLSSGELDHEAVLKGIKAGIKHLHSLGLVHNDINPSNIMLDRHDMPVIIDFDSCQWEGMELGIKGGTYTWSDESVRDAKKENDWYGLEKIEEFLVKG